MPVHRMEASLTVGTRDVAHGRPMPAALRRSGYRVRPEGDQAVGH